MITQKQKLATGVQFSDYLCWTGIVFTMNSLLSCRNILRLKDGSCTNNCPSSNLEGKRKTAKIWMLVNLFLKELSMNLYPRDLLIDFTGQNYVPQVLMQYETLTQCLLGKHEYAAYLLHARLINQTEM